MRITTKLSVRARIARIITRNGLSARFRAERRSAGTIMVIIALWLTSVLAIAEYWRTGVPAVRAVGARATAHRVLDIR